MPDFYCYYFLKFSYANSYSKMQSIISSELEHMNKEKDSYSVVRKTIEAREVCLSNVKKEICSLTDVDIEESLAAIKDEKKIRRRKTLENENNGYRKKTGADDDEIGKSWKNKLELVFELISHLRKLTVYVVELIKNWRATMYNISEDPRKYRERVIFYHNEANYLLKMTFDNRFVFESLLSKFIPFAKHYDPFFLKPCMVFENKKGKISIEEDIFYEFLKPSEVEMEKITNALVILAEEEYNEDEQTKFIYEREKFGELEQRKQYIERKRDLINTSNRSSSNHQIQTSRDKKNTTNSKQNKEFANDQNSDNAEQEPAENKKATDNQFRKTKLASSMNRINKIKSVDLKKVSPYLNRNERIAQTQKVLKLEHEFRLAQYELCESARREKLEGTKTSVDKEGKNKWNASEKEIINNKVFTKYIEANLKLNEEANKKSFIYKNSIAPHQTMTVANNLDFNKVNFKDRKQMEYDKNLESYQRVEKSMSQTIKKSNESVNKNTKGFNSKGGKAIIEISEKGIGNKNFVVDYELSGKKNKNVHDSQKNLEMKEIEKKLNSTLKKDFVRKLTETKEDEPIRASNLFYTEQKQEIIVLRQEPEKIEEIKQFLYAKIKEELMEEMKKNSEEKEAQLHELIEEEKRKKLGEIMKEREEEQNRKREEEEKKIEIQMEIERKKIDFPINVESIQYSEENINDYFDKTFHTLPQTFNPIFLNQSVEEKKKLLINEFYVMFLRGFLDGQEVANAIIKYDWTCTNSRKLKIEYVAVNASHYFMSSFHQFCQYIWKNDPADHIELVFYHHLDNEDKKILDDLLEYCQKRAEIFEKSVYSNIMEIKFIQSRPAEFENLKFPYENFSFGKLVNLKCELLSSAMSLSERIPPKMDMNLETFTNYIFLLEELFRKYLTPEEVVELRENSNNVRRLKDIFRIVLELETSNPTIDELKVIEGLNLEDLYEKLKEKVRHPYNKYHWNNFYDKTKENRLLLSILEFNLEIQYPQNSCLLNNRKFIRINPQSKVLTLRSSIYSKELVYILKTNNPKISMFIMDAENYKLMRIELFVFLNLLFNNIVEDNDKFVNSFWVPQFVINNEGEKEVKRITDFSISMKKSFYLSEEIYFANHEYIRNGISFIPKKSDIIFNKSVIMGFLHTDVESGSTGMPIYAKMIDQSEIFTPK